MSAHIVFVRFFVGYRSPFPYERFAGSNDEDINSVAEAIRHEWWSDSVNRTRFESWRIETERRRIESEVLLRGRFAPGVPVPALPDNVQCFSILLTPAPGERARIPSFLEMATAAGWRQLWSDEFLPYCISPRYPLAQFNTKELADDAAESLRARVSELFEGAATTHNRDDLAVLFWSANPQFFVVEEGELPRPALATTREQIQRLRGPISGTPTLEERHVREYWPLIVPTIDQIKALPSVDDDLSAAVEEAEEKPKLDLSAPSRRLKKNRNSTVYSALMVSGFAGPNYASVELLYRGSWYRHYGTRRPIVLEMLSRRRMC